MTEPVIDPNQSSTTEPNLTEPVGQAPVEDSRWNELIGGFPESMRPLVESDLRKFYDSNIVPMFQPDEKLEAFKPIIEKYDPKVVETAILYAEQLNSDPMTVYNMLKEKLPEHGYTLDETSTAPPTSTVSDSTSTETPTGDSFEALLSELGEEEVSPQLRKILKAQYDLIQSQGQTLETLGGVVTSREERTAQQEQQEALENILKPLEDANPDTFDRDYILAKMAVGKTAEEAMSDLNNLAGKFKVEPQSPAPVVIGAGGLPSNQRPVTELTTDETNKLVAEFAKAAMNVNNQ